MNTRLWQRVEGGLVFLGALGLILWLQLSAPFWPWWALVLLFFAPDLGFLGYLAGPRAGAVVYNLLHLYGAGLVLLGIGLAVTGSTALAVLGLLWLGHVGFDRALGYGLKEATGFHDTHLGRIGRG